MKTKLMPVLFAAVWLAGGAGILLSASAAEYRFNDPAGPLIWDFSGAYPTLNAQISQNADGGLVYNGYSYPSNYVTQGQVTESYGSVGFDVPLIWSYTDATGSGYWWTCGLSLSLTQDKQSLSGRRTFTVMIPADLYPSLVSHWWPPYYVEPGMNQFAEIVTAPLPEGADGYWKLDLDATSDGTRVSGTASITLASSNVLQFQIAGTNRIKTSPGAIFSARTNPARLFSNNEPNRPKTNECCPLNALISE